MKKRKASSNFKKSENSKFAKPKINKWLYWSPRILTILFLLFLAMFSLDIFDGCNSFLNCALGLFMHNIPVIILAICLWFAWKRELIGSVVFALAGILYIMQILINISKTGFHWYYLSWFLTIAAPAFIVAFLWYLNWKKK